MRLLTLGWAVGVLGLMAGLLFFANNPLPRPRIPLFDTPDAAPGMLLNGAPLSGPPPDVAPGAYRPAWIGWG